MAETTPLKRQRDEETDTQIEEITKRHKSYNQILSLLEAEEDEPNQDLSSLITTLQQELSSDSSFDLLPCPDSTGNTDQHDQENLTTTASSSSSSSSSSPFSTMLKEDEEDEKERVIRHLLQASDDELGIPNREMGVFDFVEAGLDKGEIGDGFSSLCDGLWDLEDEAANYYTLLQSELFM